MKSMAIASMMKSTCRSNADGGTFMDCGGTMKDAAVMEPLTVVPGAGAALVVGTAHEVISAPVPGASERHRSGEAAQSGDDHRERTGRASSHSDGRSRGREVPCGDRSEPRYCGLPLAVSVTVMALETRPGVVVASSD